MDDKNAFSIKSIDTSLDFTLDSPGYWEGFWDNNGGMGAGSCDPDLESKALQYYHHILWSKKLPCGSYMELKCGEGCNYLTWDKYRFGSDSIIVSFRHQRNKILINEVSNKLTDYKKFVEDYLHKSYTIGGFIIFPKHKYSINQCRGIHPLIGDRWDLTLECIRKFYIGEKSPLFKALNRDKDFFELFVDFKGFVDYFFLQDCVSHDYSTVDIWMGKGDFSENPYPKTVKQYLSWIETELAFLDKRNKRIKKFINTIIDT